jgi:hypothetical protein
MWLVIVLMFSGAINLPLAQDKELPPAIALNFSCPSYDISGLTTIKLFADIIGTEDPGVVKPLVFHWTLSTGSIENGQGTSRITITTPQSLGSDRVPLKVDLEVRNGPPELSNRRSCLLQVKRTCAVAPPIDHYSGVPFELEQKHLDSFAQRLLATPGSVGYLVSYAGKRACIYEVIWRGERAIKYLTGKYNIPVDRLVAVEGGHRDEWEVELFLQPNADCGPLPTPTRRIVDVHVEGFCDK